jgi:hypothetical protein
MKLLNIAILICGVLSIEGCGVSWFANPMEQPIIEDHSRGITTFGTIPSRRMVIVKPEHGSNAENVFVCAEPSPDVSDNIASSLVAATSGKGLPLEGTSAVEIAASISKSLATTAQFLFKRTQGMQLYRDGMYNLCQARMNKIISDKEFKAQSNVLLEQAVILINAEIPHLYTGSPSSTSSTSSTSSAPSTATTTTTGGITTNATTSGVGK